MEFAAVPLAASVANVETVEMGSAVVTDATESSLSETPEAPPVPQIPRGRRLHADTVFFAPRWRWIPAGLCRLSISLFRTTGRLLIDRTAGTVMARSRDVFRQGRWRDGNGGFFDTVMELQVSTKGGNRIYIGEEDSMKLPVQLVYRGNASLSSASIQTAGNQLIVKNDPFVPIKPSIASEVTL